MKTLCKPCAVALRDRGVMLRSDEMQAEKDTCDECKRRRYCKRYTVDRGNAGGIVKVACIVTAAAVLTAYGSMRLAVSEHTAKETIETNASKRIEALIRQRDDAADEVERWRGRYTMAAAVAEDATRRAEEAEFALDDLRNEREAQTHTGSFQIVHYCKCERCCGKYADGMTATGTAATEGRTVAVDPEVIPLGSTVIINGHAYVAEDVGVSGSVIDIYIDDHARATELGTFQAEVHWW